MEWSHSTPSIVDNDNVTNNDNDNSCKPHTDHGITIVGYFAVANEIHCINVSDLATNIYNVYAILLNSK